MVQVLTEGRVIASQALSESNHRLALEAPELCSKALPGQFVMVRCGNTADPFLRRAISISDVQGDTLYLVSQDVGPGTHWMRQLNPGDGVGLLGPLGQGFDLDISDGTVLMVAGGIGVAPFAFLGRELLKKGNRLLVALGGRDAAAVAGIDTMFAGLPVSYHIATEDGSVGAKGYVTANLPELSNIQRMVACGPTPMLAAVQQISSELGIPCQLSLEGKMACGVGVCLGCTCQGQNDTDAYPKVCIDGPVFWAEEVRLP